MITFEMFTAIAGAVFWYKAAEHEQASKVAWLGLSIAVSAALVYFGAGVGVMVLGQAALFPVIAVARILRDRQGDAGER